MNLATYLNEQSLLVRNALLAGHLNEARNVLRFTFENGGGPKGIRPAMIIRRALFSLGDIETSTVRKTFFRQAEDVFTAGDDLDAEIRTYLYAALH